MLAYHGDPAVKEKYVSRIKWHMEMDNLRQATGYWNRVTGKGCAIGCVIEITGHYSESSGIFHTPHRIQEKLLGIPTVIAYIEEAVFESCSVEYSKTWPLRFLQAIPVGADLSNIAGIMAQFLVERGIVETLEEAMIYQSSPHLYHQNTLPVAEYLLEVLAEAPVPKPLEEDRTITEMEEKQLCAVCE